MVRSCCGDSRWKREARRWNRLNDLNVLFHWWWAEDVAALVFLFWLVGETREAFEEAADAHAVGEDEGRPDA